MATNSNRFNLRSSQKTPTSKKSTNSKHKGTPEGSPTKANIPTSSTGPKSSPNTICEICKNDDQLRETLKLFNPSEFAHNTARLKDLDFQLTERITQVTNVDLRIQHLLLNEKAFAAEKTRMLHLESMLAEHKDMLDNLSTQFTNKLESIELNCSAVLSEIKSMSTESYTPLVSPEPAILPVPVSNQPLHVQAQSEVKKPPITIQDNFISDEEGNTIMNNVLQEAATSPNCQQSTSKFLYFGEHDYSFGKVSLKAKTIPEWLSPITEKAKDYGPKTKSINCCHINIYEDGNSFIRPHADDEPELSPLEDILTVSLGAERSMTFSSDGHIKNQNLKHGSLLVMTREMQNSWKHSIDADPQLKECRVSLSFRHIDPVFRKSTVVIGDSNTKNLRFGVEKGTFGSGMPGKRIQMNTLLDIPHPDVLLSYSNIIIHVGINDLRNDRVNPLNVIKRLKDICSYLSQRKKSINIVLSSVLPSLNLFLNQRIHLFNYELYGLSQMLKNVYFLNNYYLAGRDSRLLKQYVKNHYDEVHINGLGTATLAMAMRERVLAVVSRYNRR